MKLIKCPNCKAPGLKIILMNRFKKRHYYIMWCVNCDWSQRFNSHLCFEDHGSKAFQKHPLEGTDRRLGGRSIDKKEAIWYHERLGDERED